MAATLEKWASAGHIPMYDRWNKRNPMADPVQCGIYRPDFVYEWAEGVLVLEFDEQMHSDRVKRCELVRMAAVSSGFGARPVIWIRFNPDPFKVNGSTLTTTRKTREKILLKMLRDTIGNADYDHVMTICYLCYDNPEKSDSNFIQKLTFTNIQHYEQWVNAEEPTGDD